jgi:hypothetical protein
LREIAGSARTALSDPLRIMVGELEARADELESACAPSDGGGDGRGLRWPRHPNTSW